MNPVTVECGVSISPDDIGEPQVADNYDLNPVLTYKDELLPHCQIGRQWTAQDSAGNRNTEIQVINSYGPILIIIIMFRPLAEGWMQWSSILGGVVPV